MRPMPLLSTIASAVPGRARRIAGMGVIALAVTGLTAGCDEGAGSLEHLTGTVSEYCASAEGTKSIGMTVPIRLERGAETITLKKIVPLNAEGVTIGRSALVPTPVLGRAGYGEYGPALIAIARGNWADAVPVEGATVEGGNTASLVVEAVQDSHPGADGSHEKSLSGYRLTYEQGGHTHTITIQQSVELKAEGACAPSEGGGNGATIPAHSEGH